MLEVTSLSVSYGGLRALTDVTLSVKERQFVTVVGPNGAGKSTLFKTISGIVPATAGQITFMGQNLFGMAPAKRAHLGIAHVPEGRQVFKTLTVRENLEMGAYPKAGQQAWHHTLDRIHTLFPILFERATQLAGTLSGGEQQMVAIGRGLACAPRLLMLDEPSMGLAPAVARSSNACPRFTKKTGSPSCWSNNALPRRWNCPTTATSWKPATWCWMDHTKR
jgi:branched-chain amino acid transport system ATP-binding protein